MVFIFKKFHAEMTKIVATYGERDDAQKSKLRTSSNGKYFILEIGKWSDYEYQP